MSKAFVRESEDDEDDVPAGLVDMGCISQGAQRVFRYLAKSDQAEDERGHCCPDQQFPAGLLTLLRPAQAHRASNPSAFVGSVCRTKVIKSETVTRLTNRIPRSVCLCPIAAELCMVAPG